jgi:hypothetical protein
MIIASENQQSQEWMKSRVSIPTASQFSRIITTKGERSKSREGYIDQLAGERIAGFKEETYQSAAMLRGIETECEARKLFEIITDSEVQLFGLLLTDDMICGCSPDGLIGEYSGLEIKCPEMKTHVRYLREGKLPTDYFQQVQGSMFVTGRNTWFFMSYYPSIKPLILKIKRDTEWCKKFADEIALFSEDLEKLIKEIS